jgi:bacterioferritin-associated ferredoxin
MIICHCQSITDHDIRAAVDWMRASDADTVITPGKIYHALGKRADCGGCMPLFLNTMRANENFRVPGRDEVPMLRRPRIIPPNSREFL